MKETRENKKICMAINKLATLIFSFVFVFLFSQPVFGTTGIYESPVWLNPSGDSATFKTNEEIENFLRTAKVTAVEKIPVGVTEPQKLMLEKDGVRMHAIYRTVDEEKKKWTAPDGQIYVNFHDDCRYEYASYKLSRLLGLNNVPPVVEREFSREDFSTRKLFSKIHKKEGTLQVWIEEAMTEKDRREKNLNPPDRKSWFNQLQLMYLFDNLIYNVDRNQGNILIGPDWRIWFIDSTRAYRTHNHLYKPELVKKCDRALFRRLKDLTEDQLEAALNRCLKPSEIRTLFERKQKVVELLQELIDERGEEVVLVDF